jgi:glycosyltransferase involved in cell wall biosynthesis
VLHDNPPPLVTIGMPVYNGEAFIKGALDSLLGQSFRDFILIISDNASTDDTEIICRDCAARDSRVRYIRQQRNLGAAANFSFVLGEATSVFFMWAAVDDIKSKDFLAGNLTFLLDHPDYVGSTSPVKFCGGDFDQIKMGDASLDQEDKYERLTRYFSGWHANGRFYSLFRREALVSWKNLNNGFLGSDWTLVTHLATKGKLNRLSSGWVELGTDGMSNATNIFAHYRKRWIDWALPFNRLAFDTLEKMSGATLSQKLRVFWSLLRLNSKAFRAQFYAMLR